MDLYAVLGVEPGASADEIRRAYRQAALLWHPDRNPDPEAADVFHAVQEAYERLGDPERRRSYDHALAASGPLRLSFTAGRRPDWVPPDDEREPLRFVAGRGWISWDEAPSDPSPADASPAGARVAPRKRWTRDEWLAIAVATFAAVAGAIAIAIAPMFS